MTINDKRSAYQSFFSKHEAGREFITKLHELINQNHTKAEDNSEQARDYVQRAKGVREVIEHIQSITAERRPKGT